LQEYSVLEHSAIASHDVGQVATVVGTVVNPDGTPLTPVQDVLFCALRQPTPTAELAAKAGKLSDDDWRRLADFAIERHGVGARVWGNLKLIENETIPAEVIARFEAGTRSAAIHALASKAETGRVVAALNQAGIEPCLLKGWVLEDDLSGDFRRRETRDLDLLIEEEALNEALEVLIQLDYVCSHQEICEVNGAIESFLSFSHHVVFFRYYSQMMLELHIRPLRNKYLLPLDTLETETRDFKIADRSVRLRVPTIRWNFVYLALHGYCHRWQHAKWLVDMPRVVRRLSDSDWQWVHDIAKTLAIERSLGVALVLSRDLLHEKIPDQAQLLLAKAEGSYLASACCQELLDMESNGPTLRRWFGGQVVTFSASPRLAVVWATLRTLIVRESDVVTSRAAQKFGFLHYVSALGHMPFRIGRRLFRRFVL
jgi:hypothetical protein